MTLLRPSLLLVGLAVALVVVLTSWLHARRRRRLARFLGGREATGRLSRSNLSRLRAERMALLAVAALAVAGAAAEPRLPGADRVAPGRSIILAIDVSASMQASDVTPTRLARAIEVAQDLMDAFADDRVGLLIFAGNAYPLASPTDDHAALSYLLSGVTPTMATQHDPGSLPSVGIRSALSLWARESEAAGERTLIVIGDGESEEPPDSILAAARAVSDLGVTIHTIGVGTSGGAPMFLVPAAYQLGGPVLDAETGTPAISIINETLLRRLAEAGRGSYVPASGSNVVGAVQAAFGPRRVIGPWWVRYEFAAVLIVAALVGLLAESLLDIRLLGWRAAPMRKRREA